MAYNNSNYNAKPAAEGLSTADKQTIAAIIHSDDNAKALVSFASEKAGRLVRDGLTTSQLRSIFGEFRKIQAFWEMDNAASQRRLRLLQPKLAYQKAREAKTAHFCDIMIEAIDQVFKATNIQTGFQNCIDLLEALVAYHKSIGGRD